jgi:hypothetical protein
VIGVEAGFGKAEALDGAIVEDVFGDDLVYVLELDESVPDGLGVDDDHGAVLALIEATGLIGSDGVLEAALLEGFFEGVFEFFAAAEPATGPRGRIIALVGADEDMVVEPGHERNPWGGWTSKVDVRGG